MQFKQKRTRFLPSLDITPLIDVVFLLLVFLLLTMTFSQENKDHVQEAVIDIELAQSSTHDDENVPETIALLIDETGALYQSDQPLQRSTDEIRLFLSDKLLANPDLSVNIKADKRTRHGDVIKALDLVKSLGIKRVQLIIEKQAD